MEALEQLCDCGAKHGAESLQRVREPASARVSQRPELAWVRLGCRLKGGASGLDGRRPRKTGARAQVFANTAYYHSLRQH